MSRQGKRIYTTTNAGETKELAAKIARELREGQVLCLRGELGVGKTVFAQGLCESIGITEPVNSPTFTLVNEYEGGTYPVYHFDLYRIEDSDELYEIGFSDMIGRQAVILIEWPERAGNLLPAQRTDIIMERMGEDGRRITIEELTA
ncbi:MAG: tRNA (adenosine(37)-N6)-threonylcarbamoyltransferase complex ATPase subunit type 1 TsaE [Ruminococcaceae bacterium]|nr:tRNA (adenosine(37)-N6)-threonylcarbamoyltransferase complex ATPase subunit type 1 TsaE [Oscillospiraceae bacterium]